MQRKTPVSSASPSHSDSLEPSTHDDVDLLCVVIECTRELSPVLAAPLSHNCPPTSPHTITCAEYTPDYTTQSTEKHTHAQCASCWDGARSARLSENYQEKKEPQTYHGIDEFREHMRSKPEDGRLEDGLCARAERDRALRGRIRV